MSTHGEQARNESYESEQAVVSGKRAVVLSFVKARGNGGATREEIADGTGIKECSVCGRVNELEESGLLLTTSMRRIGRSGKSNSVVCATEYVSDAVGNEQGVEVADRQAERGTGSSNSGQPQGNEAHRSSGQVRGQYVDSPGHPLTQQLAALAQKRATTEQQLNLF